VKLKKSSTKFSAFVSSIPSASSTNPRDGDGQLDVAGEIDDTVFTTTSSQQGETAAGTTASSQPGDQTESTQRCKHCKKQIEKHMFPNHSKVCLLCLPAKQDRERKKREAKAASEKRKDKAEDVLRIVDIPKAASAIVGAGDENNDPKPAATDPVKSAKAKKSTVALVDNTTTSGKKAQAPSQGKKRKAADETPSTTTDSSKPPTKKQKKKDADAKAKATAKSKGPVDVEKQCGVILPNGQMCARSLTCKSHSMGAKRGVPGRSLRYDILLAQYQKKNQAKMQRAALASVMPLADDDLLLSTGPVDSEEEKDSVMRGIERAAPRPLIDRAVVPARVRYGHIRMKEMLRDAMGGSRGAGLFGAGQRAGDGRLDGEGDAHSASRLGSLAGSAGGLGRQIMGEGLGRV